MGVFIETASGGSGVTWKVRGRRRFSVAKWVEN